MRMRAIFPGALTLYAVFVATSGQKPEAASHGGWPAYRMAQDQRRFVWADREGNLTPATQKHMDYRGGFRVSHNGKWLAVEVGPGKDGNLWLLNLERDVLTRLTLHEAGGYDPVWSPDGEFVYFGSKRDGKFAIFRIRSDGTAAAERLTEGAEKPQVPESVSPDGRHLAYFQMEDEDWDIWMLQLDDQSPPFIFFESPFQELAPVFSPDGHWVAYLSDESGSIQLYIRPFPEPGGSVQVPAEGGDLRAAPSWTADGRRLFFISPDATVYEVAVTVRAGVLEADLPHRLFKVPKESLWRAGEGYWHVTADGERFYFLQPAPE